MSKSSTVTGGHRGIDEKPNTDTVSHHDILMRNIYNLLQKILQTQAEQRDWYDKTNTKIKNGYLRGK